MICLPKQTTIRLDERMLQNLEVIRQDTLQRDGVNLSNSDCMRKALELLRQRIDEVKKGESNDNSAYIMGQYIKSRRHRGGKSSEEINPIKIDEKTGEVLE